MVCGPWGTTSMIQSSVDAKCTLTGPSVKGIIPTEQERTDIENGLRTAFAAGTIAIHDVLRASFHDAAAYTPDPSAIFGGARGCMRFEHVHGNAPNVGLAFFMDYIWDAVGCQPGPACSWSMADILQYAGKNSCTVS